jgi:hypothetical protein
MKSIYTIETSFDNPETISVRDMKQGQIARIEHSYDFGTQHMIGEIIVCNVIGWFTLGTDRYWPSEFAQRHNSYIPDFIVRPLGKGESITIKG